MTWFRTVAIASLALGAVRSARADLQLTTISSTIAGPDGTGSGQETSEVISLAKARMRLDANSMTQIVAADEKKAYFVDHRARTYSVLPLPVDPLAFVPEEQRAEAEQSLAAAKLDVKVRATEERKKIREWNARKFEVVLASPTGFRVDITVWATKDLKVDYEAYRALNRELTAMLPGGAELASELARIDGIAVLTETSMGGAYRRREELVKVEDKTPPPGTYAPPAGYKEIPFDPLASMPGR